MNENNAGGRISARALLVAALAAALAVSLYLNHLPSFSLTGYAVAESIGNENNETRLQTHAGEPAREEAFAALVQAEQDMKDMQEAGLGVQWVNDTLYAAKKAFEGGNYTFVVEKAQAAFERRRQAFIVMDSLAAARMSIEEDRKAGLNASGAEKTLSEAAFEFSNERYENAEKLLSRAETEISNARAQETLARTVFNAGLDTFQSFVKAHRLLLGSIAACAILAALLFSNRLKLYLLRRKLKDMKTEQEILAGLIKKAQEDYYVHAGISRRAFEIKTSSYRERHLEIKRQLPVLESRMEKLARMRRIA